ncbi:hypothetical protein M8C21_028184, partial [Ambrosia artemisiifolia]
TEEEADGTGGVVDKEIRDVEERIRQSFGRCEGRSLSGHSSGIDSVSFDSSEVLVAAGAASGTIKLWDLEEAKSMSINVPECMDKLAQAGIKIWVLSGDKMETTINIDQVLSSLLACFDILFLLRQAMKQIIITLESPKIIAAEKGGDSHSVKNKILAGKAQLTASTTYPLVLIIDGKSLAYALHDDIKSTFLELAVGCASVICCRSSPKQKILLPRLVKEGTGKTTLSFVMGQMIEMGPRAGSSGSYKFESYPLYGSYDPYRWSVSMGKYTQGRSYRIPNRGKRPPQKFPSYIAESYPNAKISAWRVIVTKVELPRAIQASRNTIFIRIAARRDKIASLPTV